MEHYQAPMFLIKFWVLELILTYQKDMTENCIIGIKETNATPDPSMYK